MKTTEKIPRRVAVSIQIQTEPWQTFESYKHDLVSAGRKGNMAVASMLQSKVLTNTN